MTKFQRVTLTATNRGIQRSNVLQDATIRDFSGGLNVVDNDLNLTTKFSKELTNLQRSVDGGIEVRPGTKLFADCSEHLSDIVNCEFFSNHIVAVGTNGKLVRITSSGEVILIWDDEFANALPGSPDGWAETSFCSFTVFNGALIVANGINKPLSIDSNLNVTYLNDASTGSNANTPIARYVRAHGRYLVFAGDPDNVDRLHISATDTAGVFVGDAPPNDAVTVDLGSRVPIGSDAITGLARFRDRLVVLFEECVMPGVLGVFTEDDHTPNFDDAIENIGCVAHRSSQTIGEDLFFLDQVGIPELNRALFTGNVESGRVSQLVDPRIQQALALVNTTSARLDLIHSAYDSQSGNYMLFIPDATNMTNITEFRCFVFKKNKTLKIEAWQEWRNWNFRSSCRSQLKRIFLTQGSDVFVLGESHGDIDDQSIDRISKDFQGDQEMFSDDTSFTDYKGFNPVADAKDSGVPIPFVWELPWSDANRRFDVKASRYVNFDTEGDQKFTCDMFVDNIYEDRSNLGETHLDGTGFDDEFGYDVQVLKPNISGDFMGGSGPGYGLDQYGQNFGGGRPTRHEGLYAWESRYKINKFRFSHDATSPLKFVSISLAYTAGSIRR